MAGRRRNGQSQWDNDFKAGYAAGKRAYAKRPGTVSASDGSHRSPGAAKKKAASLRSQGYKARCKACGSKTAVYRRGRAKKRA